MKGGRLSKVRTDPRAVGLKRSIHTRSRCKRKRKRDRPENILGASKAELTSPKHQSISERRSPEQGEGLKRSIHTRSCYKRKRKRDRPENSLGASKAELISPKALGKHHWSQQSAAAHSFSHRQTLGKLLRTGRFPRKRIRRQICWRTPPLISFRESIFIVAGSSRFKRLGVGVPTFFYSLF